MQKKNKSRKKNDLIIIDGIVTLNAKKVTKGKAGGAIIEVNRSVYMSH